MPEYSRQCAVELSYRCILIISLPGKQRKSFIIVFRHLVTLLGIYPKTGKIDGEAATRLVGDVRARVPGSGFREQGLVGDVIALPAPGLLGISTGQRCTGPRSVPHNRTPALCSFRSRSRSRHIDAVRTPNWCRPGNNWLQGPAHAPARTRGHW